VLRRPGRLAAAQRAASAGRRLLGGRLVSPAVLGASGPARWLRRVPMLGAWVRTRDLPAPPTESFRAWWTRTHPQGTPDD
jgi:L-lactate dehydrogenase complex protein LldF